MSRSVRSPFVVTQTKNSAVWREYSEFDIDYEIVQTLGEGGFGRVLLVRNRKRNVQFAMKELSESGPETYREVELMITLTKTNPHVVSYFDRFVRTDKDGGRKFCIMMDYVRGVNLLDYVKKKKPVGNTVVYWFLRSALEALAHLHEMRVAHRDIKPENYIVAPYRLDDGSMVQRLVTIDFGLGSFLKQGGQLYATDAEEVVGTPNFSSPQIIDADNAGELWLDAKADDVWALGASFYYLCVGKHVATFQPGASWTRSWKEVQKFVCPDVVWPHHTLLNAIITAALSRDHEKRPSAPELLQMLTDGWRDEDMQTVPVLAAGTPVSKGGRRAAAGTDRKRAKAVAVVEPPQPPSPENAATTKRLKRSATEPAAKAATTKATAKATKTAASTAAKPRYPLRNRSK